jgi:rubrerythrin
VTAIDAPTGTKDPLYDLILLTQQALEDCFRYQHFAADAREGGDVELADLFDELAKNDHEVAERAKAMLTRRLNDAKGAPG